MKRVTLKIYQDRVKKYHQAVMATKDAYDEMERVVNELIFGEDMDQTKYQELKDFFEQNPLLSLMLEEANDAMKEITRPKL